MAEYLRKDTLAPVMGGGLLSEKVGVERLVEALQCCMWSSMRKIQVGPSEQKGLMEELARAERDKEAYHKQQERNE